MTHQRTTLTTSSRSMALPIRCGLNGQTCSPSAEPATMSKHMAKRGVIDVNTRTPATMAAFLNIETFSKMRNLPFWQTGGLQK